MSDWRARLAVLSVFLVGFVSGAFALHLYRLRIESRIFRAPDPVAQLIVYKLDRELSLTDAQKVAVRDVIRAARAETFSMKDDLLPKVIDIFERTSSRIHDTLTPEQRVVFDRIVDERRELFKAAAREAQRVQPTPQVPTPIP